MYPGQVHVDSFVTPTLAIAMVDFVPSSLRQETFPCNEFIIIFIASGNETDLQGQHFSTLMCLSMVCPSPPTWGRLCGAYVQADGDLWGISKTLYFAPPGVNGGSRSQTESSIVGLMSPQIIKLRLGVKTQNCVKLSTV